LKGVNFGSGVISKKEHPKNQLQKMLQIITPKISFFIRCQKGGMLPLFF